MCALPQLAAARAAMLPWLPHLLMAGAVLACALLLAALRATARQATHLLDSHMRIIETRFVQHATELAQQSGRLSAAEDILADLLRLRERRRGGDGAEPVTMRSVDLLGLAAGGGANVTVTVSEEMSPC